MENKKIKKLHFIGIGGVGMSGIAIVAKAQGLSVTGSDLRAGYMTDLLTEKGIEVHVGHKSENLGSGQDAPDVVVVSTAIWGNNPELLAAKEQNIPIWHRAQALAYLGRDLKTLAVAGTHGKTSTSSMLASVLHKIEQDPTFLIGGVVFPFKTNAKFGQGKYYVVEADESDKSFTYLNPYCAIVTNIEADHLDHYKDTQEIYEKFQAFTSLIPNDGILVCCSDCDNVEGLLRDTTKNVITYGFNSDADCVVHNYSSKGTGCSFDIHLKNHNIGYSSRDKEVDVHCSLPKNPGQHYALNAASVVALLDALGFDAQNACDALSDFGGIKRRFDVVGCENNITVVDDYAHHPTEIAATVKSAINLDFENVHVIWQPHRYSRFNLFNDIFHDEFANAFNNCKTVTFTNVYGAGEVPIPGISGQSFLNIVQGNPNAPETFYAPHRLDIIDHITKLAKPGDLIITMGAGDITSVAPQILEAIKTN